MVENPMLELDKNLSSLIKGKIIKEIIHIDRNLCVKILFNDGEYLIIDTMKIDVDSPRPYMPIITYYDSSDNQIIYQY